MFSALCVGQMSFSLDNTVDITSPMNTTTANLGWFMNDDILISFGMSDWDNFNIGARYYTGFCDNMFIEFRTTAFDPMMAEMADVEVTAEDGTVTTESVPTGEMIPTGDSQYDIGGAIGWTKSLGIWKLQFEPRIALRDIQDFTPQLEWALRFNL